MLFRFLNLDLKEIRILELEGIFDSILFIFLFIRICLRLRVVRSGFEFRIYISFLDV